MSTLLIILFIHIRAGVSLVSIGSWLCCYICCLCSPILLTTCALKIAFINNNFACTITGELIGIEYLFSQTGKGSTDYAQAVLSISEEDNRDVEEEDEGFEEIEDVIDPTIPALECHPEPVPPILPIPSMADYEKMLEDTCRGTYGIFIQTISYN